MKPIYLTKEGIQKLELELKEIKEVKRPLIIQRVAHARGMGDLNENAEYHAAKDELVRLERKIFKLESTLSQVRVVDKKDIQTDQVRLLTRVIVQNETRGVEKEYILVSPEEADHNQGKISIHSPVGKGLLGRQAGDQVEVETPSGVMKLTIKAILPPL
jgi:transcription elongation factor GreA